MASDPGASSCESDPNFAVVCAFLEKFGTSCGLTNIDFVDLQAMLENTEEVPKVLIDLHVKLIRKARKSIVHEKWERVLTKMCHDVFEPEDGRQLETFGYKNAKLSSKIRILKNLLEMQFDYHSKFKNEINKMSADELRSQPLGRDKLGNTYWYQSDDNYQIRIYKEDTEDETWKLVARDKESLLALISELDSESKLSSDSAANDDSSSLTEKPIMDTGQNDTSSSDFKKTSEESENSSDSKKDESSDSKKDEAKQETDGTDISEKAEDLSVSVVKDFSSKNFEEKLPKLIIKPIDNVENSDEDAHPSKKSKVEKSRRSTRSMKDTEVGEAIEEPVMLVTGEGSGLENEAENPIVGEEIEEDVMYIFGEGNGADSMTGNKGRCSDETKPESEKSSTICSERRAPGDGETLNDSSNSINERISKHGVIDNNSSEIPCPMKSPYKLGTIIDTKTKTDCKQTIPRLRKSRWDVETTVQIDAENLSANIRIDDREEATKKEKSGIFANSIEAACKPSTEQDSSITPKKQMFYFGPSSTFHSPLNESFCSFGFTPKPKTNLLEGKTEKMVKNEDVSINDSNSEEKITEKKGSSSISENERVQRSPDEVKEKDPPAEIEHNMEHLNFNDNKKTDLNSDFAATPQPQIDSIKNDSSKDFANVISLESQDRDNVATETMSKGSSDTNSAAHHEECKDQITPSTEECNKETVFKVKNDPVELEETREVEEVMEIKSPVDSALVEPERQSDCEVDVNVIPTQEIHPPVTSQKEDQIVKERASAVELSEESLKKVVDRKAFRIVDYSSDDDSLSSEIESKATCIQEDSKIGEASSTVSSNSRGELTDVKLAQPDSQLVDNDVQHSELVLNSSVVSTSNKVEVDEILLETDATGREDCTIKSVDDRKSDENLIEVSVEEDKNSLKLDLRDNQGVDASVPKDSVEVENEKSIQLVEIPPLDASKEDFNEDESSGTDKNKTNEDVLSSSLHSYEVSNTVKEIFSGDKSSNNSPEEPIDMSNIKSSKEERSNEDKIPPEEHVCLVTENEADFDDAEQKNVSSKISEDVIDESDMKSCKEEGKSEQLLPEKEDDENIVENTLDDAERKDVSSFVEDVIDESNTKSCKEESKSEKLLPQKGDDENKVENPLDDAKRKGLSPNIFNEEEESKNEVQLVPQKQDETVCLEKEKEAENPPDETKQKDVSSKIFEDDIEMINVASSEESKNQHNLSPQPQNEPVCLETEDKPESNLDDAKQKDISSKIFEDDIEMINVEPSKEESKNEPHPQDVMASSETENRSENSLDDAKQKVVSPEIFEEDDHSSDSKKIMADVESNLEKMFEGSDDNNSQHTKTQAVDDDERSKSVSTEAVLEGTDKESQIVSNVQENISKTVLPNQEQQVLQIVPEKLDEDCTDKDKHSDISSDDGCDIGGCESDNYENEEDDVGENLEEEGRRNGNSEKESNSAAVEKDPVVDIPSEIVVLPVKRGQESKIENENTAMKLSSENEVKPSEKLIQTDNSKESLLSAAKEVQEQANVDVSLEVNKCNSDLGNEILEPDSKRFKPSLETDDVPDKSDTSPADVTEMKDCQVTISKKKSKKKELKSAVKSSKQKQEAVLHEVTDDGGDMKKPIAENKSDNKKRGRSKDIAEDINVADAPDKLSERPKRGVKDAKVEENSKSEYKKRGRPEEIVEVINLIDEPEPEIVSERPKRNCKKAATNKIQIESDKTNNAEVVKKSKLNKQQPQVTEIRATRTTRTTRSGKMTESLDITDENLTEDKTPKVKNSGLDSASTSKKSKRKLKPANSTPVSGSTPVITPVPSPQTVISVTLDCENTAGSSSDVEVIQEKDPLAVSESDQEGQQTKPMTLSSFSMDFDECAVLVPEITRRVLRKRGRECDDNLPKEDFTGGKKPKLKGKRSVDVQIRKSVEQQKSIEISSSDEEDNAVVKKTKLKGKRAADLQVRKSVEEQKCIQISSSEEDNVTTASPQKKVPKKGKKGKTVLDSTVKEAKTSSGKIDNETKPDKEKIIQNRNKRLLANLGINSDDISSLTEVPSVRQSRRIAQIRIKEDAEKTQHKKAPKTDMKPSTPVKEKSKKQKKEEEEYKPEKKKKNKIEVVESDEEVICIEDSSDIPGKKKRRRKKHVDPRKIFDVRTPWKSSSDESSEENNEVVEEEEYYSEPEELLQFKSDHEFSPESDLEEEWKPLKRARTARNESDVEELDDCPCQKCGKSDHPESILLCDQCDKGWHCSCLRPPFFVIPEGDWFCPPCQHVKLLKALQLKLQDYEKKLVKKELEDRRKERLAYVGISLSNVLRGEGKRKDDSEEEGGSESGSESASSESDSDEPIYQLRQRRQAHSYRFNDYDDLINSAIQDEMEAVKGAGNQGRGKDIQTIVNAEKEEEMRRAAGVEENENEVEPLPPVVPKENIDNESTEVEKGHVKSRKFGRKKSRKLNSLDIESEDDNSDEDFKGSSSEPEDDEDFDEDEVVDSDDSSKRPVRRSTRARTSRYDADFVNDDSSSDDRKKKRMKKPTWYESESEESEGWGKKKKQNSRLKFRPLGKRKLKKKKKRHDDSDLESYKQKKPKIKYGGLSSDDEAKGRRTRGRKINYVEALGSDDSEEDNKKKASKRLDSDDEYVGNEEEQEEDEKISEEEAPTEEENEQSSDDHQKKIPKIKMKVKRRAIIESDDDDDDDDEEDDLTKKRDEKLDDIGANESKGDCENNEMNTSDEHKNLDEMDEAEVEKMMEDEEYANRQLQLVAKQLEKKRRNEQKNKISGKNSLLEKQLEAPIKENSAMSRHGHQSSIRLARLEDLQRPEITDPENLSTCGIDMTMCRNDMDESSIDDFEESLIANSIDNDDLSEPPGVSLPMFSELASLSTSRKPRKQGKTKKSIRDALANLELARTGKKVGGSRAGPSETPGGSHIEIAAPPQPFAQAEPTPSVITRMLQSEPLTVGAQSGGGNYPVGTIRPKQFAMLTEKEGEDPHGHVDAGLPAPPVGRGHGPPHYNMPANQRGPVPYRQLPPVMGYPRGAPPPHFPPHNATPQPQTPHVFHPHRNMDPSPSGGGPVNMSAPINMSPTAPLNMSATVLSERSSPSKDVTPPPYSRQPPPRAAARPVQGVPPHLIPPQGRGYPMSSGYPAPFSYGPAPMLPSDEAVPPPPIGYQGPPYQEAYQEEAASAGNHGEAAVGKGYEDELGGEFGGLVSYFSSQREDDLDS